MRQDSMYRYSSIGRRLDRRYPTNRAVMIILPIAGLVAAGWSYFQGEDLGHAAFRFFGGAIVVFLGWALGRELAPDNARAAFVSLLTAFAAYLAVQGESITLMFAALMLIRVVNRSTGLPARLTDSIAVTLLVCYTVYATGNRSVGAVAAIAFAFDAILWQGRKVEWMFAAACAAAADLIPVKQATSGSPPPPVPVIWLLTLIGVAWAILILRTRILRSTCDATGEGMSAARTRAAMLVGLLLAWQSILAGTSAAIAQASLVWAVLAGLLLGQLPSLSSAPSGSPETGTKPSGKS